MCEPFLSMFSQHRVVQQRKGLVPCFQVMDWKMYFFYPFAIFLLLSDSSSAGQLSESTTWMVRERNFGLVCLLIRFNAFFRIRYTTRESEVRLSVIPIPPDATLTSGSTFGHNCRTENEGFLNFDLSFGREEIGLHNVVLRFHKDEKTYRLLGFDLEYTINPTEFPNHRMRNGSTLTASCNEDDLFAPRGMSFVCQSVQELAMSGFDDVTLIIKDMQFEAFSFQRTAKFSDAVNCDPIHKFLTDYPLFIVFFGSGIIFASCLFLAACLYIRMRIRDKQQRIPCPSVCVPEPQFPRIKNEW